MPYYAIFEGSTFKPNGFNWRPQSTPNTSIFKGLLVQESDDLISFYGGDQRLEGGMIVTNCTLTLRAQRATGSGIYVSDLQLPSGNLSFRTLFFNNGEYFVFDSSYGTISGDGAIQYGGIASSDTNGIWSLAVEEASIDFNGTVNLVQGELTLAGDVPLPNASFEMDTTSSLVLDNDLAVSSFTFGLTELTSGTYTAAELNSTLSTDRFSGTGTLSFEYFSGYIDDVRIYDNALTAGEAAALAAVP